jgi:Tn3 transposase DDE domain-containing protein
MSFRGHLLVAAIIVWNTIYLEQAVAALRAQGQAVPDEHLPHLVPLGWEHVNLTGDYVWDSSPPMGLDHLRPLRTPPSLLAS